MFDARTEVRRKSEEAKRLRAATLPAGMLDGTGSELWTALWEAARRFSQEHAYRGDTFPVVEDDARCVLCQQDLDHEAGDRLRRFEAFVASTTEQELRRVRDALTRLQTSFAELKTTTDAIDQAIKEIRIEHEAVADAVTFVPPASDRRQLIRYRKIENVPIEKQDRVHGLGLGRYRNRPLDGEMTEELLDFRLPVSAG